MGQAEAVSQGILSLAKSGRISAVSCMVNQSGWREAAIELRPLTDKVDVGLHLNFTLGAPLSALYRSKVSTQFPALSRVMIRTLSRLSRLQVSALRAEINAQLDTFVDQVGYLPQFIDGHQHIHHLPVIREVLLDIYDARLKGNSVYLRAVTLPRIQNMKALIIHLTGGRHFASELDARGIPHNTSFAGIYDFSEAGQYRHYFQSFLAASASGGLIMCHPGLTAPDHQDPIAAARVLEYQYLSSDDWLADCTAANVSISRFSSIP